MDLERFVEPRYPYARVEAALAEVFGIAPERRGPLKGRLKHLNSLGVPGLKVGKGARVAYSLEQVAQWVIGLLIEETGVDPTVTAELVKSMWERSIRGTVRQALDDASRANHVFLTLRPRIMTGPWIEGEHPIGAVDAVDRFCRYDTIHGKRRDNMAMFLEWAVERRTWLCVRDLTADFEVLRRHLDGHEP